MRIRSLMRDLFVFFGECHVCALDGAAVVFVSCAEGNDSNTGLTEDAPLRTLQVARDKMRSLRANAAPTDRVEIHVLASAVEGDADAGRCELSVPLELDERDSGVHWLSQGGTVLVSGGVRLKIGSLLHGDGGVVEVDLRQQNISDFGDHNARGYSGGSGCISTQNFEPSALELFYRDASGSGLSSEAREMVLARYPDLSYPVSADNWMQVGSVNGSRIGVSTAMKARMRRWRSADAIASSGGAFAHGLWTYNWADSHRPILSFDAPHGEITLGDDDVGRDTDLKDNGNFYVYNLRDELDQPGEFHLDVSSGTLSFIPPAGASSSGTYHVSVASGLLVVTDATDISFTGFEFRYARGAGVVVRDCQRVTLANCTIGDVGMMALNVTRGKECGATGSVMEGCGDAGAVLEGGDRVTLEPARHFVVDSTLHHNQRWIMNYAPHVLLAGVGNIVRNSEIYNTPQMAVFMQGNDHSLLDSYIHDAGQQCGDCGAFYTGREWTYRGNVISRNTWSRISTIFTEDTRPPHAVYLDDFMSGITMTENVFDGISSVLFINGGRNNVFERNLVNNSPEESVHLRNLAEVWWAHCQPGTLPWDFLNRVPFNASAVWKKYPNMADLLDDDPCMPKHNVLSNNVMCNGPHTLVDQNSSTVINWGSKAENNTECTVTPDLLPSIVV